MKELLENRLQQAERNLKRVQNNYKTEIKYIHEAMEHIDPTSQRERACVTNLNNYILDMNKYEELIIELKHLIHSYEHI